MTRIEGQKKDSGREKVRGYLTRIENRNWAERLGLAWGLKVEQRAQGLEFWRSPLGQRQRVRRGPHGVYTPVRRIQYASESSARPFGTKVDSWFI